jgi:GDPmannose 4,6-dehydratase
LTEDSYFKPSSPYAAAKLYGYWLSRIYRQGYNFFASNGILFNHESPLRGLEFVTRKISNTVAKISLGIEKKLCLGNLDAKRDWGYAPDYVSAMWLMLQQKEPGDYVVATNESHSVKEFVEKAFDIMGLDWQEYVEFDNRLLRPVDVNRLCGDCSRANEKLGWEPKVKFAQLVNIMVTEDLSRWERWQNGERFPWDAACYPSEYKIISRYQRMDR